VRQAPRDSVKKETTVVDKIGIGDILKRPHGEMVDELTRIYEREPEIVVGNKIRREY